MVFEDWDDVRIDLMRRTGIFDIDKINKITLKERSMILLAIALRNVDKQRELSIQAIYSRNAELTDKEYKYICQTADDLFDFEKAQAKVYGKDTVDLMSTNEKTKMNFLSRLNSK